MKYNLIILILICCSMLNANAQVPQYSQYYANALYLNPAFAGSDYATRGIVASRYQWPSLSASYFSNTASVDHYMPSINSGVGIMLHKDIITPSYLNTTDVAIMYAYEVPLNNKILFKPAIQAAYVNRSIDMSGLTTGSQLSDNGLIGGAQGEAISTNRIHYADFAAGGLILTDNFWMGVTAHHINEPNQTFIEGESKLPTKFSLYGGYKFMLLPEWKRRYVSPGKEISITPTMMYKTQGSSDQLDVGVYGRYGMLITGIWYRSLPVKMYLPDKINHDALILMAGIVYGQLKIGYSYDFTLSKLTMETGGSHEITLSYSIQTTEKKKPWQRKPSCPEF